MFSPSQQISHCHRCMSHVQALSNTRVLFHGCVIMACMGHEPAGAQTWLRPWKGYMAGVASAIHMISSKILAPVPCSFASSASKSTTFSAFKLGETRYTIRIQKVTFQARICCGSCTKSLVYQRCTLFFAYLKTFPLKEVASR